MGRRITISKGSEEKNKVLVLEAFHTLFNQRDYVAAERYWPPNLTSEPEFVIANNAMISIIKLTVTFGVYSKGLRFHYYRFHYYNRNRLAVPFFPMQ
ncbi:MAG: hypothetical protein WCC17_15090 [Candidatus Nitrosopolaris sp.]